MTYPAIRTLMLYLLASHPNLSDTNCMNKVLRFAHIALSFGLCLVIEHYSLNPRLRYAMWALMGLNELRAAVTVYYFGHDAFNLVR